MHIPQLDLKRQIPIDPAVVERVLLSGRYINGPELSTFEKVFAEYLGTGYCLGVGNGTDAIELALRAVGIEAGQEVATVANAGMYATTAIRTIGAVPLYVDIDPDTLLLSLPSLESSIGPLTKALVVTHLYGRMAPMEPILEIAARHGLAVIEDCAQAHGARRNGRKAGCWGLAGCFSFYPTKNLGAAGDAGAIVTSDAAIAGRVRALREYGWTRRFQSEVSGGRNSRMDEIQAAILTAKLPGLDQQNAKRQAIAARVSEALSDNPHYSLPPAGGPDHVFHLYVIRCRERDRLQYWLAGQGIETTVHYPVPDHLQESQKRLPFRTTGLAATEQAVRNILSLPCFPELSEEEVGYLTGFMVQWPGDD